MTTRRALRWVWLLSALCAACTGGQSGNEGAGFDGGPAFDSGPGDDFANCGMFGNCPGNESPAPDLCACEEFVGWQPLHAVVTAFHDGRAELQVREVSYAQGCVPADLEPGALAAGDVVAGAWDGRLPCGNACAAIAAGDEVLALYAPAEGDALDSQLALAPWHPELQLGGAVINDEEAFLLAAGGAECRAALRGTKAQALETEAGCVPADATADPGAAPAVFVCRDAGEGLDQLEHARLGTADVCPGSEASSLDCRDVCGTLVGCGGDVVCDDCLERCARSPQTGQDRCLSRAIYWIDEEGCDRMLAEYAAFDPATQCD